MLLRYDRRSLVLYNRWPQGEEGTENNIDISRVTFAQITKEGETMQFAVTEWKFGDLQNMTSGSCYQLWMPFYHEVAGSVPPADICTLRKGFITTQRPFWLSDDSETTFSVLLDGEEILTCPTALNITDDEFAEGDIDFGGDIRCIVDLP